METLRLQSADHKIECVGKAQGCLVGTHSTRQYCIDAILLDLDNPSRVIDQTSEPLLVPAGRERFGYVPNVV
jgi:predicted GH43/DUF377 family glycosyl hydrolase